MIEIVDRGTRPELRDAVRAAPFGDSWPTFMQQDPVAGLYYDFTAEHGDYILVALDEGEPVAVAYSVPFVPRGDGLPDTGWDAVVRWSNVDRQRGGERTACSALEINVLKSRQGTGLSAQMLAALRANARRLGHTELVAPVRPSAKHLEPHTPMVEYALRTRDDGLPVDPWLRVHVRGGGVIDRVCPVSMTIPGTLAQWREWTGLPFDADGPVVVPGALSPVMVSVAHDVAVYVEPNVWIRHRL